MTKRLALTGLLLSALAIACGYGSAFLTGAPPAWAAWALALGTPGTMVAVMVLGAARDGRIGRLVWPFAFVFLILAGGFALVLSMEPLDAADPTLWLGLPRRAAIVLYGIGLLPLFIVPIAYALTFDEMTLSEEDWQRVRAAAHHREGDAEAMGPPEGADHRRDGRDVACYVPTGSGDSSADRTGDPPPEREPSRVRAGR